MLRGDVGLASSLGALVKPVLHACLAILIALLSRAAPAAAGDRGPLVLAAASLQESLTAAARAWEKQHHPRPVLSFGASSALARQVESGAPADLFISADEAWMDELERKALIDRSTRRSFLGNRLVLIAPAASSVRLRIMPHFPLVAALGGGRLAMADPKAVPAGLYGKAALTSLGVWSTVAPRVAAAENVRAALAFVERGEAPLGIVYATDAKASRDVRVVGTFPESSHPPISYPVARIAKSANPDAAAFERFLLSDAGRAIFRRFAFTAR